MFIYLFFFSYICLSYINRPLLRKKIKGIEWKTFFQAWHDRWINRYTHARVSIEKDNRTFWWAFFFIFEHMHYNDVFLPFVIRKRERENGNDSLLLIITVGVQLNYHFFFSLAVRTWMTIQFDQTDALVHIKASIFNLLIILLYKVSIRLNLLSQTIHRQ